MGLMMRCSTAALSSSVISASSAGCLSWRAPEAASFSRLRLLRSPAMPALGRWSAQRALPAALAFIRSVLSILPGSSPLMHRLAPSRSRVRLRSAPIASRSMRRTASAMLRHCRRPLPLSRSDQGQARLPASVGHRLSARPWSAPLPRQQGQGRRRPLAARSWLERAVRPGSALQALSGLRPSLRSDLLRGRARQALPALARSLRLQLGSGAPRLWVLQRLPAPAARPGRAVRLPLEPRPSQRLAARSGRDRLLLPADRLLPRPRAQQARAQLAALGSRLRPVSAVRRAQELRARCRAPPTSAQRQAWAARALLELRQPWRPALRLEPVQRARSGHPLLLRSAPRLAQVLPAPRRRARVRLPGQGLLREPERLLRSLQAPQAAQGPLLRRRPGKAPRQAQAPRPLSVPRQPPRSAMRQARDLLPPRRPARVLRQEPVRQLASAPPRHLRPLVQRAAAPQRLRQPVKALQLVRATHPRSVPALRRALAQRPALARQPVSVVRFTLAPRQARARHPRSVHRRHWPRLQLVAQARLRVLVRRLPWRQGARAGPGWLPALELRWHRALAAQAAQALRVLSAPRRQALPDRHLERAARPRKQPGRLQQAAAGLLRLSVGRSMQLRALRLALVRRLRKRLARAQQAAAALHLRSAALPTWLQPPRPERVLQRHRRLVRDRQAEPAWRALSASRSHRVWAARAGRERQVALAPRRRTSQRICTMASKGGEHGQYWRHD